MASAGNNHASSGPASSTQDEAQQQLSSKPGAGWSNGTVPVSMYPVTRQGRVSLYSTHRRWIPLTSSWARVGGTDLQGNTTTELSRRTSLSKSGASVITDLQEEATTVKSLISQLCEVFYKQGWATGTGGGVSIRTGGPSEQRPWRVFVAPSGIQKEDMIGDDVFELDMDRNVVVPPTTPNLRMSACTPLWYVVYQHRPTTRCVIHTHSLHAQMATLLDPTETTKELRITHLEMLKGVGNHAYDDVLTVPIIDNRPTEDALAAQLTAVIQQYPLCNAVLVRRHGLYAWGDSWEQAKTQCESFDYLFQSCIQMKAMGIDYSRIPTSGTYRVESDERKTEFHEPQAKKQKIAKADTRPTKSSTGADAAVVGGFHGKTAADNANDLDLQPSSNAATTSIAIPLVPRNSKVLLLDIEGCTTAISFVHDTLFPYVTEHLMDYLLQRDRGALERYFVELQKDVVESLDETHPSRHALMSGPNKSILELANGTLGSYKRRQLQETIASIVVSLMKHDVKVTGLKRLQGDMWKSGYENGTLKGHVYPDFCPLLEWCKSQDVSVNIYSSGSINAQKLLFGFSEKGDLTGYLSGYFDTTSGSKKEAASYQIIASALQCSPSDVMFVSDSETELAAAQQAGMGHVVMSIRRGNVPLTPIGKSFPQVHSLLQLCGV